MKCQYVFNDKRSVRPRKEYVEALEISNQEYQRLMGNLRKNVNDHQALIRLLTNRKEQNYQQREHQDELPNNSKSGSAIELTNNSDEPDAKGFDRLLVSGENWSTPMVLGPTSVYHDGMLGENNSGYNDDENEENNVTKNGDDGINKNDNSLYIEQQNLTPNQVKDLEDFRQRYGYQNYKLFYFKDTKVSRFPLLRECISIFFKWMYSSLFLFIHRESFLYFFLNNEVDCEFVSMDLIYAISALGARISKDEYLKSHADIFYNLANKNTLEISGETSVMAHSSISKLQSLLCLALYDLGRGELTRCWLLSGLAFRMGLAIGFELDPKNWNVSFLSSPIPHTNSTPPFTQFSHDQYYGRKQLFANYPFDIRQVRSRIFWGSYVVDRFICLVMGRSTTLMVADATIPNTQDIGDLTGLEDFIFYDHRSDRQYTCRAFYCLKAVVELHGLSDDILNKVFSPSLTTGVTRLGILSEFNIKLLKWKQNLDRGLFWNKTILQKTAHNELCMGPRYTFFIIILSINRPFVLIAALGSSKSINIEIIRLPIQICDDVIDDLEIVIKALKAQEKSFDVFYPHILSVYATILAISVLLWRFKMSKPIKLKKEVSQRLELFVGFLEKCSDIWSLASKPSILARKKINELWLDYDDTIPEVNEFEQESNHGTKTNIEFEFGNNDVLDINKTVNFEGCYEDMEGIFQSIFGEPMNQQMLTRTHLADALWDEAFFDNHLELKTN